MFYLDMFRCLQEHNVRYLLVDGLAMNLYGVHRWPITELAISRSTDWRLAEK